MSSERDLLRQKYAYGSEWRTFRESLQAILAKEVKEAAALLPPALLQDPIEARPYRDGPEADEIPCYHGLDLVPDAGPVLSDEAKRRIEEIVPMTSELDAGLTKGNYVFVTTTGGRAYHGQVEASTQRGFWLVGAAVVYETPLDHKSEPKRMFIAWDAVETVIESPANAEDDGEARNASWEDAKRWQRDVRGATLPHNFLGVDVQVNLHSDENRSGQIEEVRSTGVLVEDRRRSHAVSSEHGGPGRRKVLSFIPWTSIDFIEWERTD